MAVSSPAKLINLEEAQAKLMAARHDKIPPGIGLPDLTGRKCIDVNGGPAALPPLYHTVIDLPPGRRYYIPIGACHFDFISMMLGTPGDDRVDFEFFLVDFVRDQRRKRGNLRLTGWPNSPCTTDVRGQE